MEAWLPHDKLDKYRDFISVFPRPHSVNFACMVLVPARAFLPRSIDLTTCIRKPPLIGFSPDSAPGPSCSKLGYYYPVDNYYQGILGYSVDKCYPPFEQLGPGDQVLRAWEMA